MPKKKLEQINACPAAMEWAESMGYDEETPMIKLWDDCHNLDWMMWFYLRLVPPKSKKDRIAVLSFLIDCYDLVIISDEESVRLYEKLKNVVKSGRLPKEIGDVDGDAVNAYGHAVASNQVSDYIRCGLFSCLAVLFSDKPENFGNVAIVCLDRIGVDLDEIKEGARLLFRSEIVERGAVQ